MLQVKIMEDIIESGIRKRGIGIERPSQFT